MTDNSTGSDVGEEVDRRSRAFERAYVAGDAARLVDDYFVSDATAPFASPPGGVAPVRGRAALTAMFSSMFPEAPAIRLSTEELVASGEMAFEMGRAFLTLRDGTEAIGRYAVCWIRADGEWRVQADFFTTDGWPDLDLAVPTNNGGPS